MIVNGFVIDTMVNLSSAKFCVVLSHIPYL